MKDELIRLGVVDDNDIILDEAALSLALLDHPDVDDAPYRARFLDIATSLANVGSGADDAHAQADALSHVLADQLGFAGDEKSYDDPANADLIRVIDRRRGLPISLSILYVAAARRLGWTANILNVPGHVLVLIGQDADPVIVDPFHGGVLVTHDRLAALAVGSRTRAPAVSHLAVMPNRAVLVRLLLNQASRAEQAGQGRRALTLYKRMTMLAPGYDQAWWDCARLELVDGNVAAARANLTAMLEITREAGLRGRINDILNALPVG